MNQAQSAYDSNGPSTNWSAISGIVAVIPAYNEERFIASVVLQTRHHAQHVIVVDDGSLDRTASLAEAAGAIVISSPHNAGKATALTAGFAYAQTLNPNVVVCLDGDAQHEPAEIPLLIRPILEGQADVVISSRFLATKSKIPVWRQVGQHALTHLTNGMSSVRVSDSQSGFRAFSPAAVQTLCLTGQGLSAESEMQFHFQDQGLRIAEVPISIRYQDGNKRNPVVHGLQVIDALISLVARRRPLLFFCLPGLLLFVLGALLGLRVTLVLSYTGDLLVGSSIVSALLLKIGVLLGVAGIILHAMMHLTNRLREEFGRLLEAQAPRVQSNKAQ